MNLSSEFLVFLLAVAPISELRGAIPTGFLVLKLPFWKVFLISLFGNLFSVFLVLLFLGPISKFLSKKSKFFKKLFNWIFHRTRKRVNSHILKYEEIGLLIFVAIPLPLTGGWTGAIAAFLLGLPFKLAFPLIAIGVLIAGGVVSALTLSGVAIDKIFGWQSLLIFLGFVLLFYIFYKIKIQKKNP